MDALSRGAGWVVVGRRRLSTIVSQTDRKRKAVFVAATGQHHGKTTVSLPCYVGQAASTARVSETEAVWRRLDTTIFRAAARRETVFVATTEQCNGETTPCTAYFCIRFDGLQEEEKQEIRYGLCENWLSF